MDKGKSFIFKGRVTEKETVDNLNISRLQFDPQDTLTLYLLSKNKGLWVSYNGGESVENLVEGEADAFALDPEKRGTIYLAKGAKILQSRDGGTVWNSIPVETGGDLIAAIAVHPSLSARIFAVTRNGSLFGSEDNGASWRLMKKIRVKTIKDLIINSKNPNEMYIATEYEGVFQSEDMGVNWNILHALKSFKGSERVHQFKINQQNPSHLFLASSAGLLISQDSGGTWTAPTLLSSSGAGTVTAIGFNPLREQELYYGTKESLFKSVNNGESWSALPLYTEGEPVEILVDDLDGNIVYIGVGNN